MDNEMSSGGSEGWWKSGAVAEPWGETTTVGSYTVQERAVDTPCKRALGAMVEAEGDFGKSFVCRGFWQSVFLRQWLPATALLPLVDGYVVRQELVRYHSGYEFERLPNSESPTIVLSPETLLECPGGISVCNGEESKTWHGAVWTGVELVRARRYATTRSRYA
jgi:hypothetical protein